MPSNAYVYIMASKRNGVLYIGSTTDLVKRIWEHKTHVIPCFTSKYKIHRLVYFEIHQDYYLALSRERQMKKWERAWKIKLIQNENPQWKDLYLEII